MSQLNNLKNRTFNPKIFFYFLFIFYLSSCSSNIVENVMVTVPKNTNGSVVILFGQEKYPPLRKKGNLIFAPIINDTLRTSTSLSKYNKIAFQAVQTNEKGNIVIDPTPRILNYAFCYVNGHIAKNIILSGSQEFYIGCIYNSSRIRSKTCVKEILKKIGVDTLRATNDPLIINK